MWAKRVGWIGILAVLGAAGCKKKSTATPKPAPSKSAAAGVDESLFPHTPVRRLRDTVPPRFGKPLPRTLEELEAMGKDDVRFPPESLVHDALCAGDRDMRERLVRAFGSAEASERTALAVAWSGTVEYCEATLCSWAAPELPTSTGLTRDFLLHAAAECPAPELDPLYEASDVPSGAIVKRAFRDGATPTFTPRLVAAVRDLVQRRDAKADTAIRALAWTLDARAAAELRKLHAETTDPKLKNEIASNLGSFPKDAAAAAIFAAYCKSDQGGGHDCKEPHTAHYSYDDADKSRPPTQLADCARSKESYEARECLQDLARADRALAVTVARELLARPKLDDYTRQLAAILDRFPEPDALRARLAELGLLGDRKPSAETAPLDVEDWLTGTGRAIRFDTETGTFPNQHDSLLRKTLAPLTGGALSGVEFDETPPPFDEANEDTGAYQLHAFMDGFRFTAVGENLGDWYDVGAALGLLNYLLLERESAMRCLTLPTGDQTAIVLCGPASGIKRALAEGLIESADARAAMDSGKAFEDKVFKELEKEGGGPILRNVPLGTP